MKQKTPDLSNLLGRMIHVQVDRPVGFRHRNMVCPVNYGFVPGMIGGDGEEQDVYILGVSEPVTYFEGRVIGIIHRHDDCEDKLVAAPENMIFHQGEIAEAVHFQEQYFSVSIECLLRRSCGVIPFRKNNLVTEFLVLLQKNGSWSFPKGHMEAFETEQETALRETLEETGLRATLHPEKRIMLEYSISSAVKKQVVLFPGEVTGEPVLQKTEISGYRWATADELAEYLHPDTYEACTPLFHTI